MLVCVYDVLSEDSLEEITGNLASGKFFSGKLTAGKRASARKENLQLERGGDHNALSEMIRKALRNSKEFMAATHPVIFANILFNCYDTGMSYGYHVDAAIMDGNALMRTDIAVTVFLSSFDDYDGGELAIDTIVGEQQIKLDAGSAIVYPASMRHRVLPVTRGTRLAAVTWVQSRYRDPQAREILYDLHKTRKVMNKKGTRGLEVELIDKTYNNLIRRWIEF